MRRAILFSIACFVLLAVTAVADYDDFQDGLFAYWSLDSGAYDIWGWKYNGTLTNLDKIGGCASDGCYEWTDDGDKITISNIGTDFGQFRNYTISLWASKDESGDDGGILDWGVVEAWSGSLSNFSWLHKAGGLLQSPRIADNNFHHFVMTYEYPKVAELYVDGIRVKNLTSGLVNTTPSATLLIGQYYSASYSWDGKIDEIGLWKKRLNQSEIIELYNAGSPLNIFNETFAPSYFANITTYNLSYAIKDSFASGEDFFPLMYYGFDNGTLISGGNCSVIIENLIKEYPALDDSFTLCGSGCDYEVFEEAFSVTAGGIDDYLHFSVCYNSLPSLPVTFRVACPGASDTFILNQSDIPACSSGEADFFLGASACLLSSIVNVTAESGAPSTQRRVTISDLSLDRDFSSAYYQLTYNSTTRGYSSHVALEEYILGTYDLNGTCDGGTAEASMSVTITDNPPSLIMDSVENGIGVFRFRTGQVANVSYAYGNWSFIVPVMDIEPFFKQVIIRNASQVIGSWNASGNYPIVMNQSSFLRFSGNLYNISVLACDTQGACSRGSRLFLVNDTISPFCTGLSDFSSVYGEEVIISPICYDEALFSFNLSCSDGFVFGESGIIAPSYSPTITANFSVDTTCSWKVCDAHTDKDISGKYKKLGIEGGFIFSTKGALHTFRAQAPAKVKVKEEKDRVSSEYVFTSKYKTIKKRFIYSAPADSVYIASEQYRGWIVTPSSGVWFDAETDNPDDIVSVTRENGSFIIDVWTDRDNITFNSIGLINCYEDSFIVTIEREPEGIFSTYSCPDSTGGMMLFIFLIALDVIGAVVGVGMGAYGSIVGLVLLLFSGAGMLFLGFVMMGCFPVAGWIMLSGSIIILGLGLFVKV